MEPNDAVAAPAAAAPVGYNPIFEKLVDGDDDGQVLGIVAYGLYKIAKREWASEIARLQNRPPTQAELDAYIATWTPSQLENVKRNAAQVLSEYADSVISAEEPRILRDALRGSFWRGVWPSFTATLLYTLALIALAIVLARSGIDLIGILQRAAGG